MKVFLKIFYNKQIISSIKFKNFLIFFKFLGPDTLFESEFA